MSIGLKETAWLESDLCISMSLWFNLLFLGSKLFLCCYFYLQFRVVSSLSKTGKHRIISIFNVLIWVFLVIFAISVTVGLNISGTDKSCLFIQTQNLVADLVLHIFYILLVILTFIPSCILISYIVKTIRATSEKANRESKQAPIVKLRNSILMSVHCFTDLTYILSVSLKYINAPQSPIIQLYLALFVLSIDLICNLAILVTVQKQIVEQNKKILKTVLVMKQQWIHN